jgi:hypothetical protein
MKQIPFVIALCLAFATPAIAPPAHASFKTQCESEAHWIQRPDPACRLYLSRREYARWLAKWQRRIPVPTPRPPDADIPDDVEVRLCHEPRIEC